ncbi:MAG: cation diffusion facilitator family transporter [Bacteroidota bacterium]|nr:cation diffusion facilitator family transporter [Bacteroidota bacterium]
MNRAFIIGIILNFAFVIIEVVAGLLNHSLSLLSDAGHNLADVGALGLSLFAFKMLKVKSNDHFTYGYRKTSILIALLNAVVLLISIGIIVYEAVQRFFHPQLISGMNVSIIAGIGIVINFFSARMFFKDKESDLNIRSAYLHLMSDAVVSLGIVVGGVLMFYYKWFWLDPALSIIIAIVILVSTWQLLKESLRLSLDAVPENISIADIKTAALNVSGVKDFHHIHVWAMSTTENALTAHLVLASGITNEQEKKIKQELKHDLQHKNIHHITLETERGDELCETELC